LHSLNLHSLPTRSSSDLVIDGKVTLQNGHLSIEGSTEAILYFTVATSFRGFQQTPGKDFQALTEKNKETLEKVKNLSYDQLKSADRKSRRLNSSHVSISY